MAQTKKELSEQLEALGVEFNAKSTVKELTELLVANQKTDEVIEEVAVAAAVNDETSEASDVISSDSEKSRSDTDEISPEGPDDKPMAKAGKRSAKAIAEAEEKQAKEERKASGEVAEAKPKAPVKPTRSRLERRSKGYRKSAELIERGKTYSVAEAVDLAKKTSHVKFDASVELHINLGVDPRQADQNIRDVVALPAGTGKTVNVAVADDALLAKLEKGVIDFDILVATPDFMPKLGKYARVLGPRGLMPNPKSGTVTTDIDRAVAEAKAGRVEYRVDSTGIVHLGVGKVSFDNAKLQENIDAVLASIKNNKPSSVKGTYLKAIYLTTSMGPSISVDANVLN